MGLSNHQLESGFVVVNTEYGGGCRVSVKVNQTYRPGMEERKIQNYSEKSLVWWGRASG